MIEYTRGTKCKIQYGKEGVMAVSLVEWGVLPGNTVYLGQKYNLHCTMYKNVKEYWQHLRSDGVYGGHTIQNTKQMQESVLG